MTAPTRRPHPARTVAACVALACVALAALLAALAAVAYARGSADAAPRPKPVLTGTAPAGLGLPAAHVIATGAHWASVGPAALPVPDLPEQGPVWAACDGTTRYYVTGATPDRPPLALAAVTDDPACTQ